MVLVDAILYFRLSRVACYGAGLSSALPWRAEDELEVATGEEVLHVLRLLLTVGCQRYVGHSGVLTRLAPLSLTMTDQPQLRLTGHSGGRRSEQTAGGAQTI